MSTHIVAEQLLSVFPSILTFDFDISYRSFLAFGAQMGCFGCLGVYSYSVTTFVIHVSFNSDF